VSSRIVDEMKEVLRRSLTGLVGAPRDDGKVRDALLARLRDLPVSQSFFDLKVEIRTPGDSPEEALVRKVLEEDLPTDEVVVTFKVSPPQPLQYVHRVMTTKV
jgi:hypothetical protein